MPVSLPTKRMTFPTWNSPKKRPAQRTFPTKPRPVWNRWFTLLAGNSAVPIWGSWLEQGFFGSVLRVDHQRWDQTVADLRHLALSAAHPRSRERFLALHEIADGSCATAVAERTARRAQTVMGWLHADNEHGPKALSYQRSGGRPPFVPRSPPRLASRSAPRNVRPPVRRLPEPR